MNYKQTIFGSTITFIIVTSCCWLPALIIGLGGGATLIGISNGIGNLSGLFMAVGACLLGFGAYQFYKKKIQKMNTEVILKSTLTCPKCGHKKEEITPTNACQFFYDCENCKEVLRPLGKDCCVYCSYGTVPCPPIQLDQNCC